YETARDKNKPIIPVELRGIVHIPMQFRAVVRIRFSEDSILSALAQLGFFGGNGLSMRSLAPVGEILPEILLGSDLRSLISKYDETEKKLTTELISLFQAHMESLGAIIRGSVYEMDGAQFTFYWEQSAIRRELDVVLVPNSGRANGRRYSVTIS